VQKLALRHAVEQLGKENPPATEKIALKNATAPPSTRKVAITERGLAPSA
jgi:hypothetical protein